MRSFSIAIIASLLAVATAAPAAAPVCNAAPAGSASSNTTNIGAATPSGNNIQVFTGSLGGAPPPVIETQGSNRPFSVDGDTFVGSKAALGRSCDKQHNACASAANSGSIDAAVSDCDAQNQECHTANGL